MKSKTKVGSTSRWTNDNLEDYLKRAAAIDAKPPVRPQASSKHKPSRDSMNVIISSIIDSVPYTRIKMAPDGTLASLSIWLAGAHLLTYNQIISLLQRRLPVYFRYKKAWQTKMREVISSLPQTASFTGYVSIDVMRQSARLVDRDGITNLFKILIDSLRQPHPTRPGWRVIQDDSPLVVVDVVPYQRITDSNAALYGSRYGAGLRIVALPNWCEPSPPDPWRDWLV